MAYQQKKGAAHGEVIVKKKNKEKNLVQSDVCKQLRFGWDSKVANALKLRKADALETPLDH